MSKRPRKASLEKINAKICRHFHFQSDDDDTAPAKAKKPKPRVSIGPVEGAPAKARLDRPGRRIAKADGGSITLQRQRKKEASDEDRRRGQLYRASSVIDGLGAAGAAAMGALPLAGSFGLSSLGKQYLASQDDAQANDRDAQAAAVEDLINRGRGTDVRSRVYGMPDQISSSDVQTISRRRGGKVGTSKRTKI